MAFLLLILRCSGQTNPIVIDVFIINIITTTTTTNSRDFLDFFAYKLFNFMAIGLTYSNYRVQKWYLMKKYWWFFREFETRWFPIFNRGVCGVLPWRLLFPLWLIGPVQCGHWHIFYRGAPCTLHLIFYRAGTWYFTLWGLDLKKNCTSYFTQFGIFK